jgi:hypothetical protein
MFIHNNKEKRETLREDIIKLVSEIRTLTDARGLKLIDKYFAGKLGISYPAFRTMMRKENLPTLFTLKARYKILKTIHESVKQNKLII